MGVPILSDGMGKPSSVCPTVDDDLMPTDVNKVLKTKSQK